MPTPRPIRRLARDALLACGAALAVVAAHRRIPPSAPPRASAAEAEAAFDAALRPGPPDVSTGPVRVRAYDVRDLLRGPVEYAAIRGEVDGPEGHLPRHLASMSWLDSLSVRDQKARPLIDLLDRLAPPPAEGSNRRAQTAGGRLFIARTAAGHARVEAVLNALRLAERARPAYPAGRGRQ